MSRWIARITLVLTTVGAVYGLYLIRTPRGATTHVWPVHSHHVLFVTMMTIAWIIIGIAALFVAYLVFMALLEAADWYKPKPKTTRHPR